jgi:hypothetical protein
VTVDDLKESAASYGGVDRCQRSRPRIDDGERDREGESERGRERERESRALERGESALTCALFAPLASPDRSIDEIQCGEGPALLPPPRPRPTLPLTPLPCEMSMQTSARSAAVGQAGANAESTANRRGRPTHFARTGDRPKEVQGRNARRRRSPVSWGKKGGPRPARSDDVITDRWRCARPSTRPSEGGHTGKARGKRGPTPSTRPRLSPSLVSGWTEVSQAVRFRRAGTGTVSGRSED